MSGQYNTTSQGEELSNSTMGIMWHESSTDHNDTSARAPNPSTIVFVFAGVLVVCLLMSVCTGCQRRRQAPPSTDETNEIPIEKIATAAKIRSHIQENAIILEEKNFDGVENCADNRTVVAKYLDKSVENEAKVESDDDLSTSEVADSVVVVDWRENSSGFPSGERREISNSCAICINSYRIGDSVVCASNPACNHVFHDSCIEQWLLRQKGAHFLCPCCRQPFLRDDHPDLEKGTLYEDTTSSVPEPEFEFYA